VYRLLRGEQTGKDPTNRGTLGTKRHLVVDRNGVPLAVTISASNVHDSQRLDLTVDAILPLRLPGKRRGRPRHRPLKLHADKGYDYPRCRQALRRRWITPRIARRGIESRARLGRYRWVVEPTLSWLIRFRRLKVRHRRRADIHQAFLTFGCAPHLLESSHQLNGDKVMSDGSAARGGDFLEAVHVAAHSQLAVVEQWIATAASGGVEPHQEGTSGDLALSRRQCGAAVQLRLEALALSRAPFIPGELILRAVDRYSP
jgi:transposase